MVNSVCSCCEEDFTTTKLLSDFKPLYTGILEYFRTDCECVTVKNWKQGITRNLKF